MISLLWVLQIFFLDTYYEDMKMHETERIATQLTSSFGDESNLEDFSKRIKKVMQNNDVYIRVETANGKVIIAPEYEGFSQLQLYSTQATDLRKKLLSSQFNSVSTITAGANDTSMLSYACYLYNPAENHFQPHENSYILYLFSPLFPVQSTISILKVQLVYITIIAFLLAMAISLYLSTYIARPIKSINNTAKKMGSGNYGVQFESSYFTEISDLAHTLNKACRELEKTSMYQRDLIANVSHDLRTPLTMIKSYAEMVKDLSGDNPEKREAHLNIIIEETDRLNSLVNDMLSMAKLQSRQIALEPKVFDIAKTLQSLLMSYNILSDQEGYKIKFTGCSNAFIEGDEAKLKQVLTNLINNAVKYCGEDKEIIISLQTNGKSLRFEVSDHGAGIPEDELDHIWERYYKSSAHHVRPTEGSGLGLSIVKEILIMHKAKFGVNSQVGEGSTFWFELPLKVR